MIRIKVRLIWQSSCGGEQAPYGGLFRQEFKGKSAESSHVVDGRWSRLHPHRNGLVEGKILTGNQRFSHRFSHEIWGVFPKIFPTKPIHWPSPHPPIPSGWCTLVAPWWFIAPGRLRWWICEVQQQPRSPLGSDEGSRWNLVATTSLECSILGWFMSWEGFESQNGHVFCSFCLLTLEWSGVPRFSPNPNATCPTLLWVLHPNLSRLRNLRASLQEGWQVCRAGEAAKRRSFSRPLKI